MRSLPEPAAETAHSESHALNCVLFAAALIWFLAQQPVSWPQLTSFTEVNPALQYFPRTPPPIFEPEILDFAQDSTDPYAPGMPI